MVLSAQTTSLVFSGKKPMSHKFDTCSIKQSTMDAHLTPLMVIKPNKMATTQKIMLVGHCCKHNYHIMDTSWSVGYGPCNLDLDGQD